jgi:plastocyanin
MKYILILAALAASYSPARAAIVDIAIDNFQFGAANATVTVNVGDTVRWTNMDGDAHTVASGPSWGVLDGRFGSGNLEPSDVYSVAFRRPGTFPYFCEYHPNMVSAIKVVNPVKTVEVTVQNTRFGVNNESTSINVGDTVKWVWLNGVQHTVTSGTIDTSGIKHPDGTFNGTLTSSLTQFSFTFTNAGTFPYYCSPHGPCCAMRSSVIVSAGPLFGDADGNGTVGTTDVAESLRVWAGLNIQNPARVALADVYPSGFGDGSVDLRDVLRLIRFIGGADTTAL